MTTRDRIVLMVIAVVGVLAAGWLLVVSPEQKQANEAQTQVQSARQELESAQSQAASGRAAQRSYAAAYTSVVSLGKAVPPSEEVPSLIYQLELASDLRSVDFSSITSGGKAGSSSASASSASIAPTTFTQMPFTFVFNGSFANLVHLFNQVEGFAVRTSSGGLDVSGRLLTIQGVTLASKNGEARPGAPLTATITATAYVLPASQGLTAGATSAAPNGAPGGSSSSSLPTTPAVVRATP